MGRKFLIVLAIIFGAIEASYFIVLNAYAAEDLVPASSPVTPTPHDPGDCTLTVKVTGLLQFYVPQVTIDRVPYEWTSIADLPDEKREFVLVAELRANRAYYVSIAPDRFGDGHGSPPYMFSRWSGDVDSSELSISVLMDGDKVIFAEYVPVLQIIVVLNMNPLQFLTPKVPVYVNGTKAFDARITALEPYTWTRPGYIDYSSFCRYGLKSNTVVNVSVPEYMPIFLPLLQLHAIPNWQIVSEAGYDAIFIYRVELVTGWMLALQLSILLAISTLLILRRKHLITIKKE